MKVIIRRTLSCSKETMSELFEAIQDPSLGEHRIKKPNPSDFLAGLYFLKIYPKKSGQAGFAGRTEKTGLENAWKYVRAFQALKEQKVRARIEIQHAAFPKIIADCFNFCGPD